MREVRLTTLGAIGLDRHAFASLGDDPVNANAARHARLHRRIGRDVEGHDTPRTTPAISRPAYVKPSDPTV